MSVYDEYRNRLMSAGSADEVRGIFAAATADRTGLNESEWEQIFEMSAEINHILTNGLEVC